MADILTSESSDSITEFGIGSGQNSSGTKLIKTLLISGAENVGQTFKIYSMHVINI